MIEMNEEPYDTQMMEMGEEDQQGPDDDSNIEIGEMTEFEEASSMQGPCDVAKNSLQKGEEAIDKLCE